jgi:hypothetical protein
MNSDTSVTSGYMTGIYSGASTNSLTPPGSLASYNTNVAALVSSVDL